MPQRKRPREKLAGEEKHQDFSQDRTLQKEHQDKDSEEKLYDWVEERAQLKEANPCCIGDVKTKAESGEVWKPQDASRNVSGNCCLEPPDSIVDHAPVSVWRLLLNLGSHRASGPSFQNHWRTED